MTEQWYYAQNGQQQGPVSAEVFRRLAETGQLQPTDLVWKEGMANWAPARTVAGVFPEPPTVVPAVVEPAAAVEPYGLGPTRAAEPPSARPAAFEGEPAGIEEGPWERRPRRRRKGNPALLIGGIVGGVILLIGVVVVLIIVLQSGTSRTFRLRAGEMKVFNHTFHAGKKVQIWIKSDENTDIDLFVKDSTGQLLASDVRDLKDCYVWFVPPQTGTYRVEVANINRGGRLPVGPNRCTMTWKEE
jgi:hypothetical protein